MKILKTQKLLETVVFDLEFTSLSKIETSVNEKETTVSIHGITTLDGVNDSTVFEILSKYFKLSYYSFKKDVKCYETPTDENGHELMDDDGNPLPDVYVSQGYSHLFFTF